MSIFDDDNDNADADADANADERADFLSLCPGNLKGLV